MQNAASIKIIFETIGEAEISEQVIVFNIDEVPAK